MGVIYAKIWSDLWHHKARTLQVVLIIAMGAAGIGLVLGARNLITEGVAKAWLSTKPPMIKISVNPAMEDDEVLALEKIEGAAQAEGLLNTTVEWRLQPGDEWQVANLSARDDYTHQKMGLEQLVSGRWPHKDNFAVGDGFDAAFDVYEGNEIYIRIDDKERVVKIDGALYGGGLPPTVSGRLQLYATRQRFGELTGEPNFNVVQTRDTAYDPAAQAWTDLLIQNHLKKLEIDSAGLNGPAGDRVSNPVVHPAQTILDAVFLMMGLIGAAAMILGLFLIYNAIDAILTQQTSQIGVMKAIGGKTGQMFWSYLALIFAYAALAFIVSMPLAAIGAWYIYLFFANLFNFAPAAFTIDPTSILVQVGIVLFAPLVAALLPISTGVRITVREAISTYGLQGGTGWLERLVAQIKRVPYIVLLIIGNAFRNKKRVTLTQITLVGSGMVFMVIIGVGDSTTYTFTDKLKSIHQYQATLKFEDLERIERIEQIARQDPSIQAVEIWYAGKGDMRPASQAEASVFDKKATLVGVPTSTTIYTPDIRAGRWLVPTDTNAVVLHVALANEIGVAVDDWITLDDDLGRESRWQVVGLLFDPMSDNLAFTPMAPLQTEIGHVNKANTVWLKTRQTDQDSVNATVKNLQMLFDARNMTVDSSSLFGDFTVDDISADQLGRYDTIILLLAGMAVLIAVVGGVGLSGMLSLSVLERRREIGVMRAIGASSGVILRLFIGEGLLLGFLSWLIALPLSIPAAYYTATQGLALALDAEIIYQFTLLGPLYWLAIITVLAVLASWYPARDATQISVQESLMYQ